MEHLTVVSEHDFQHKDPVKTPENEGYFLNEKETNEVKSLCIRHVPFWNNIAKEKIDLKIVSGALTNRVYQATLVDGDKDRYPIKSVCIKKSSTYNSLVIDDDLQYRIAKLLGDNNFGPRIIGRFGDFTIQEWVEGNTMGIDSFQNLSVLTGIASSLAKFHKKVTELVPKEWDRTPMFLTKIATWSPHVERIIKKYNLDFDYNELVQNYEMFKKILNNHLNTSNSITNSILFCHNDLFSLNILDFNQGIYFIDFDFAGFNYVGWEIANFFVEVTILYDPPKPPYFISSEEYNLSEEMKTIFISVYLSQLLGQNVLPSDDLVNDFLQSLEIHTLGVNLFWTYWGIVMSDKPKNELSKPVKLEAYAMFQYNLFRNNIRRLTDNKIVNT
ncbi:choline/ethanolamine kinase, putative [Theileria annulata]|uniref:Choline/ethanolamine kinase, putative n=1 Tax=Theileria annulata TaxID=5874 RepID=Q4UF13_THEAN|nr:choline/ethanolamine kinase, putative [Theileria annulata]CAI74326.1 choline/ethanolamine kinase, putative [Theileria annulata]|eukprot:XP_952058.1 choline/ethanolamine kinase, putative [Theileria annulata]